MAADNHNFQNPPTPQSIPLRDLSRPPDYPDDGQAGSMARRSFGDGARALLGNRQNFRGRVNTTGRRYERVAEVSPPSHDDGRLGVPHVTTPRNAHQPPAVYEDSELSPGAIGDFHAAVGSMGLSFDPGESREPARPPVVSTTSANGRTQLHVITEADALSPYSQSVEQFPTDNDDYYAPVDSDRTPLTDERFLSPISGAHNITPTGQRHDRSKSSPQSTRASPSSRLGDDLPNAEGGSRTPGNRSLQRMSSYSTRSLSRSLSVSAGASPLSTAGSMLRKVSQRVVNLSNEPEIGLQARRHQANALSETDIAENNLQRSSSFKHARLEAPPSFPAMIDFEHEDPQRPTSPALEKSPHVTSIGKAQGPSISQNPLKGKSLGIFAPDNRIRLALCELLVHPITEPVILILIVIQTILLAIGADQPIVYGSRSTKWGSSWIDYALLVLFVIYSAEIMARIIVSGFVKNAAEYSSVPESVGFKKALYERYRSLVAPQGQMDSKSSTGAPLPSIIRSFTLQPEPDMPGHSRQQQRARLARRAFMRHSFNRLDFLAVISFWISFLLSFLSTEPTKHVFVFQMLSSLRILRLLGLTSGTSVILRSLKKAAPLLVNVAFLISFFWLLFAIVGVQNFKSSFRRTCVWFGDDVSQIYTNNYTQNLAPGNIQFCGGHIDVNTGAQMPWLKADFSNAPDVKFSNGSDAHKGYLCPQKSLCIEGVNPYENTVSFDNVFQSLQLVFVIMSSNTFSDLLYYTTDSDYLAAALFFAFGIFFMTLWLTNLLVAVITSSFQVIREEGKASAFTMDKDSEATEEEDDESPKRRNAAKRIYEKTYWFWIIVIILDMVVQSLRTADMEFDRAQLISTSETIVTLLLLFEIILRFLIDWRNFHKSRRNWLDLGLAVITSIIQVPVIRDSGQTYAWLTFFQILRIYRVVLALSITQDLILKVLGNVTGLLNLILFVVLITFLAAIFAVQLFRGEFQNLDANGNLVHVTFDDIYNSFLGMYQILSSENWTVLMYDATQFNFQWDTAWYGGIFFVLWFVLANFIILNMFIAVIQENFDVTEDEKRLQQVKAFLQQKELGGSSSHGNLSLSSIFRFGRDKGHRDPIDYGPATMEMLLKDAVVHDFLDEPEDEDGEPGHGVEPDISPPEKPKNRISTFILDKLNLLINGRDPNPFYSRIKFSRAYEDLDPRTMAKEVVSATEQRKKAQRQYLQRHPRYNVSLFIFTPSNTIRRLCQRVVGPGRGSERIEGVNPVRPIWYAFSAVIYAAIVAMVVLATVTTPLYQREYFIAHGYSVRNWFVWTDMGFAAVFTIEAVIKVIADGFFFTPNAYFRGSWGFIDGLVLVTLWINVVTSLYNDGGVTRAVGAFKALRALRLLNVSDSARNTFHSVIVLGGWKVLSAALVSLSLLIPFAIYGLNLFNGQMELCNDTFTSNTLPIIVNLSDCTGEYMSSPFNWNVLSPRQVANPYYNFDNFGNSLFILFQIVSQEGWVDVMWTAMGAAGRGKQYVPYKSQGNAVFFIVFNLLGAVFVLTLFVSVFMRNYTEQTGVAFLTAEQRSWLELRKLLRQISPSKRPSNKPDQRWRIWCYRIAVKKHGLWQKFITGILIVHLILLSVEFYPEITLWEQIRDYIFVAFTAVYVANIVIRIVGLTWKRFRKSSWDIYSLLSVGGTIVTTVLTFSDYKSRVYTSLHKGFLVSIALLLIPRNNQLDQLFKTAAASLTAIGNLMATWFVLFLVFAIALTQTLGLTRFGSTEKSNLNFRTVPKALVLLFRMSMGEGWNQIMEDYAQASPPFCIESSNFFDSDCGSAPWARTLFIAWNILSMYIFVSMFVSLIFESFSYVYQRSSGLAAVSREEIRRFKQAWAEFDPDGTGYISKEAFPRLLGELSGVFEMRIYDGDHTVNRILEHCRVDPRPGLSGPGKVAAGGGTDSPAGVIHGIDLAKLNERLNTINVSEIRRRRSRMNIFCQEVLVSADPDRGIPFTSCLMILAHYNVISDSKALRLEEFLRRRARLQRVQEEVRRQVVKGFFDTLYFSRIFRHRQDFRHSARMMYIPQFSVPEIFVDNPDGGPSPNPQVDGDSPWPSMPPSPMSNVGPPSPGLGRPVFGLGFDNHRLPETPTTGRTRGESLGSSPSRSEHSWSVSPTLRARRPSSPGMPILDEGFTVPPLSGPSRSFYEGSNDRHRDRDISPINTHSRSPSRHLHGHGGPGSAGGSSTGLAPSPQARSRGNSSAVDRANVLEVFNDSAWGESIRRSFTVRRTGTKARRGPHDHLGD